MSTVITELIVSEGAPTVVNAQALGPSGTLQLVNNASGAVSTGKASVSAVAYIPARDGAPWGYGVTATVTGVAPGTDLLTLTGDQAGEPTPDPIVTVSGALPVTVLDASDFVADFQDSVTSAPILPRPIYAANGTTVIGVFIALPTNTTGPVRARVDARPVDAKGVAPSGCSPVEYTSTDGALLGVYPGAPGLGAELRGLAAGICAVRLSCTNAGGTPITKDIPVYVAEATGLGTFTLP